MIIMLRLIWFELAQIYFPFMSYHVESKEIKVFETKKEKHFCFADKLYHFTFILLLVVDLVLSMVVEQSSNSILWQLTTTHRSLIIYAYIKNIFFRSKHSLKLNGRATWSTWTSVWLVCYFFWINLMVYVRYESS